MRSCRVLVFVASVVVQPLYGQEATAYKKPPKEVQEILDVPPSPQISINPTRTHMLLLEREGYPSIEKWSQPFLRLAGHRINPRNNGPRTPTTFAGFTVRPFSGRIVSQVKFGPGTRLGAPHWSPDGNRFACVNYLDDSTMLMIKSLDPPETMDVNIRINAAVGTPLQWTPDSKALLVQIIDPKRGEPPSRPTTPSGPTIEESSGKAGPVRTFQDMLKDAHDEALFDYYASSQLAWVDVASGKTRTIGKPSLLSDVDLSPDGKHLLVTRIQRPYSYVLPSSAFPRKVEVWDLDGTVASNVADLPLADRVPIEGVPTGRRSIRWKPTEPATLVWVEALDGGDPKKKVTHRDRIWQQAAPFNDLPKEWVKLQHRFSGVSWMADGQALVTDYERERRRRRTFLVSGNDKAEMKLLWDRSVQDRYGHPGTPLTKRLPDGGTVLARHGDSIFLEGDGASPKGDRPFLDRYNLKTQESERLFQSDAECFETVVTLLSDDGSKFLTRRESSKEPANYYVRTAKGEPTALTNFKDPTPQLRGIKKQLVTYKRADGVPLSFTLYLPPDYVEGKRLPAVLWAYPREFVDAADAGQVAGSTQHFTRISGISHLFFLMHGYAVLDGATMPVVGSAEKANDTYVEQIVSSAKAAIDKAHEMGVIDRNRVGVGGHSYGAFMTANLLAHCDLFRAGIARSGAYNRTLTPFGFQSERRTLWEAPEIYAKMSPFMHANKINEPILLIHGAADSNPGTFPVQSERLYQAIRGNGGTVRYVVLPHEDHGYAARESVEHTLAEMLEWFDRHVKNVPKK